MPTNLPTGGTYGRSQVAADQYNYWVKQFVGNPCSDGSYRVMFDNTAQTVSEGIGYGMLLSAYAGDKVRFDGFWKFFLKSKNANGLMNWMTDGCNGNARDNAATDADLDAALALIIASKQWPNATSPYTYKNEAVTLLGNIKRSEMDQNNKNTLNGDMWFDNNKLNPSYQSPAYYVEYAKIDVANKDFWNGAAIAASNLLKLNRNATTGLVSNWCHADGSRYADKTPDEYGADACRNPWRMATDVLWHGTNATASSKEITTLLSSWISGHESTLKGPMQPNADNPGVGTYANGTYTTFALAPMAMGSTYQTSLNSCYTNIAGMGHDNVYFNETIRTITLFTLTGNFWAPDAAGLITAPEVLSAESSEDGSKVTVVFTKDIIAPSASEYASFKLSVNGAVSSSAITAITAKGTDAVVLTISAGVILAGQKLTLAYTAGTIKSTDNGSLASVTGVTVKNNIAGNSTILDDCEDGNGVNQMGGAWFTYDDHEATDAGVLKPGASIVTPKTSSASPYVMADGGADGSLKSAYVHFVLDKDKWVYSPFIGLGLTLNPEGTMQDLSTGTGISFWYKGDPCRFQLKIDGIGGGADYGIPIVPASATTWEFFSFDWADLTQPSWANNNVPAPWTAVLGTKIIQFAWHKEGADELEGDFTVDHVQIEGLVPTKLTSFVTNPATKTLDTKVLNGDTATIKITYTPANATYKEVIWISSNPLVATVDQGGLVTALSSGKVNITATSKFDATMFSSCQVTVLGTEILPTSVTIATPTVTTIAIDGTVKLSASLLPTDAANKTINWTSSNANAIVDATGLVTGRIAGTATIKAASDADPTIFDEVVITVEAADVKISAILGVDATKTLNIAEEFTFVTSLLPTSPAPSNTSLSWETTDATKVSVDQTGKIVGVAVGSATVTVSATDGSGISASCVVTVEAVIVKATSVELNKTLISLAKDDIETLVATVKPSGVSNDAVEWISDKPAVATVDQNGKVTAVSVGTAVITVTTKDGSNKTATCGVEVLAGVDLIETIAIVEGNQTLVRKGTVQLTTEITPAVPTNSTILWESLDPTIATVSATGLVTAVKVGSTTITASSEDAGTATKSITVEVTPILVSSISVNATKSIMLNDVFTFEPTFEPTDADVSVLSWISSSTDVTVDQLGKITGVAVGSATITVSSTDGSNISKTIVVTVNDPNLVVAVESVTLDESAISLKTGESQKLTQTVNPNTATNTDVTWLSSNPSFVTVDGFGNVKAVAKGTATITVTSAADITKSASCDVTVTDVLVTAITVSTTSVTVDINKTATITASADASATVKTLSYTIAPAGIATISNGVITGIAKGDAELTIAATDGSGISKTVTIKVNEPSTADVLVSTISLDKTSVDLETGKTTTIATSLVLPSNATNKAIDWKSTNAAVATYNNGTITAVSAGTAVIIASSADAGDAIATCVVTVKDAVIPVTLVTKIALNESVISITSGTQKILTATVTPSGATNSAVEYISSNTSIAQVSATGTVSAVGAGTAVITVRAKDGSGVFASVPVTVTSSNLAQSITLAATGGVTTLNVSASTQLTASVTPSLAAQAVKYISSNQNVLFVDASGKVTALAAGTASITAIATDGSLVTKSIVFTVKATEVAVSGIELTADETELVIGDLTFYTVVVSPETASNLDFRFDTDKSGIIEINKTRGTITALAAGTVVLKATALGEPTKTSSVTITVEAPVVVAVNKEALTASITTATDLKKIYAGNTNGAVQVLIMDLEEALAASKLVKSKTTATQDEVNASSKALLSAINKLNTAVLKTDDVQDVITVATVYPQPAIYSVTITGSKTINTVTVVSKNGSSKVLASGVGAETTELSVSSLVAGNYSLVVVYTDGSTQTLSLIVE